MRCLLLLLPYLAYGQSLAGLWDATVTTDGVNVPFRMKIAQQGTMPVATLYDGAIEYPSDAGSLAKGKLHLHWNIVNADLDAVLENGELSGSFVTRRSNTKLLKKQIHARPAAEETPDPHPAQVQGAWILKGDTSDPKNVWTLAIAQTGDKVSGAIQRLDGDSGTLTGTIRSGKLVMSHFSGIRPAVLRGELENDGSLKLVYNDKTPMTGIREDLARAKGVSAIDPKRFTSVKNPNEPFPFSFPDLTGKIVANTDERYRGRVVLVNITGSWCPNCNDDAPFLEQLYKKYQARGLEVVGLSFESGDVDYDRDRVREFISRNGVTYPILLAGTTDNVAEKLPFVVNFGAFPTTFFLGRDGRVRMVHDGFSGPGTGAAYDQLKTEIEEQVKNLLASDTRTKR